MEDRIVDYSQPLLAIKQNIKRLENALLKNNRAEAEAILNSNVVEHIIMRTWIKHENYQ